MRIVDDGVGAGSGATAAFRVKRRTSPMGQLRDKFGTQRNWGDATLMLLFPCLRAASKGGHSTVFLIVTHTLRGSYFA